MTPLPQVLHFPPAATHGEWWQAQIICGDAHPDALPDDEYRAWLAPFWREVQRGLVPGGRFALNVTPTSIKDFKPVHYDLAAQLRSLGLTMRTEKFSDGFWPIRSETAERKPAKKTRRK